MAMTLALPSTPSSVASDDGAATTNINTNAPRTPVSPTSPVSDSQIPGNNTNTNTNTAAPAANGAGGSAAQMKRKPSRRANTAERRATHNAVERQRRETLNGRFLDLAALLPNLSQIRRPSKSSIVNSSIAHIHASRRHRMLAARELRLLKLEADALRRELNEWRDRAGIPRVEEPLRGEGFSMVLGGELELISPVQGEEEGEDGEENIGGYVGGSGYMDEGDDDFAPSVPPSAHPGLGPDDMEDHQARVGLMALKAAAAAQNPFAHNLPPPPPSAGQQGQGNVHLTHILPRPGTGGMMSPAYESPMGGLYDAHHLPPHHQHQHQQPAQNQYPTGPHFLPGHAQQQHHHQQMDAEKMAAYAAHMYGPAGQQQQQHMMQAQRSLFTPPATSHGLPNGANGNPASGPASNGTASPTHSAASPTLPSGGSGNPFQDQAFFASLQRQQLMHQQQQQQHQQGYGSDDASSISSAGGIPIPQQQKAQQQRNRERSGSLAVSVGSYNGNGANNAGGSPVGSPAYELGGGGNAGEYGVAVPRRGGPQQQWGGRGEMEHHANGAHGMMVNVGVGGGGGGFAMMM